MTTKHEQELLEELRELVQLMKDIHDLVDRAVSRPINRKGAKRVKNHAGNAVDSRRRNHR